MHEGGRERGGTWHWRPSMSPLILWICWVSVSRRAVRAPRLFFGMSNQPMLCLRGRERSRGGG